MQSQRVEPTRGSAQYPATPAAGEPAGHWVLTALECEVKPLMGSMWNRGQRIKKHNSGTC